MAYIKDSISMYSLVFAVAECVEKTVRNFHDGDVMDVAPIKLTHVFSDNGEWECSVLKVNDEDLYFREKRITLEMMQNIVSGAMRKSGAHVEIATKLEKRADGTMMPEFSHIVVFNIPVSQFVSLNRMLKRRCGQSISMMDAVSVMQDVDIAGNVTDVPGTRRMHCYMPEKCVEIRDIITSKQHGEDKLDVFVRPNSDSDVREDGSMRKTVVTDVEITVTKHKTGKQKKVVIRV